MLSLAAQPARAAGPAGSPSIETTPLDIVILVDESGSESNTDVRHEIEAAGTIAQTPLNVRSRVTVVGFGGADGAAPNQDPTSVACQPTVTNGVANLEYLARCPRSIHRRSVAEGDNTDYAAALSQAMSFLAPGTSYGAQSPAGAVKAVLMMTDGGLYVAGDPQYPQPDWLAPARHAVNIQLAAARAAGVEVWPLGFGSISAVNRQYLEYIARSGGQRACDSRDVSKPHAVVAQDSAHALNALYTLYAAASCSGVSSGGSTTVPGGQSRVLTVSIPPIASGGAISVNKGSPAIRVDFIAPDGTVVTGGSLAGATYSRSGADTSVEVLHITNPPAGAWQVRATAPGGQASQLVSVTAFWQGAVRVSIVASPPTARPGQRIGVVLSVLGAHGPITDPALLSGMAIGVTVAGDRLSAPVAVPVHPAAGTGQGGLTAGDYSGTFAAPSTQGTLTFTGAAAGYGLHATEVPTQVSVSSSAALLQGIVQFTAADTILAGQVIHGQVLFDNKTGQPQHVRLTLAATPVLATLTEPPGEVTVPSGTSVTSFAIAVARRTPLGAATLTVRVVGAGQPNVSYGNQQLLVIVRAPPGLLGKYRWQIAGLILVIALAAAALYLRSLERRRESDVRDLLVGLTRDGVRLGQELKAPGKESDSFRFMIRDEDSIQPRLDYPQPGEHPYVARRVTHGRVRVRASDRARVVPPGGGKYTIVLGGAGEPMPNGVYLSLRDRRDDPAAAQARTPGRRPEQAPPPGPAPADRSVWD